jgi:hypothetical protein
MNKKNMNKIIKIRILTPIVFTLIAIGFFGISIAHMVDNVSAEKDIEKNSNIERSTVTSDSSKDTAEKCSPLDPRGC